MKNRYLAITIGCVIIIIALVMWLGAIKNNQIENKENANLKTGYKDVSSLESTNTTGEVKVKEDSLVFEDEKGNTMTYVFEGEALTKVEWRIKYETEEAALNAKKEYEAEEFKNMYDSSSEGNLLVLKYKDEYIKSYANMTRTELEDNLIKGGYELKK